MLSTTNRDRALYRVLRGFVAFVCAVLIVPADGFFYAQGTAPAPAAAPATPPATQASDKPADKAADAPEPKLPPEQLDSLVAPIALYPDPLLAQTLVASTYPLEIIQLQQWMAKNPKLKDKELADAVAKEPWDPAIQSMAAVPEVVKRLSDDIQWTTDLGNAFLAQQSDVMDAVQRMRKVAKDKGALESNEQQKVETQKVEGDKTVIVVQPSNPEVIYVPSYSPTVVYGPPVYPYPPIYYPPYPPGAAFVSFSFGVMMGAAMWGGSCCGCGWGGNNVNINVNNNFNRNTNINRGGAGGAGGRGGGNWSHNPSHRGGAPYSNKSTANKYGGSTRGQSPSARQQPSAGNRGGSPSASNRAGGSSPSAANRGGGSSPSASNRGGGSAGTSRVGNQSVPKSSASSRSSGFGGGSGGFSGSSARASSSRGSSSFGGGGRGGGGRGGGGRGGGGRR